MKTYPQARWESIKSELGIDPNIELSSSGQGITIGIIDSGYPPIELPNAPSNNNQLYHQNYTQDPDIYDHLGHGTSMHSVITDPLGISPRVNVVHYKIDTINEKQPFQNFEKALSYIYTQYQLTKQAPDVLLIAKQDEHNYNHYDQIPREYDAIHSLLTQLEEENIILIASSGNHYAKGNGMSFPAIIKSCISVTGSKQTTRHKVSNADAIMTSANFIEGGECCTDIIAPGENIPSYTLTHQRTTTSGTSPASALVASCTAVLKEVYCTAENKHSLLFNNHLLRAIMDKANTLHDQKEIKMLNQIDLPNCIGILKSLLLQNSNNQSNESHQTNRIKFS